MRMLELRQDLRRVTDLAQYILQPGERPALSLYWLWRKQRREELQCITQFFHCDAQTVQVGIIKRPQFSAPPQHPRMACGKDPGRDVTRTLFRHQPRLRVGKVTPERNRS